METSLEMAKRHVDLGRQIVERHERLIQSLKAVGRDTMEAEMLLDQFRGSQKIFEDDYQRLLKKEG